MKDDKELCPIHKKQEIAIIFMFSVFYWKVNLCIEKFFALAHLQCTVRYFREKIECSHDLEQSMYVSIIWYQSK